MAMNAKLIVLAAALAVTLAACSKKTEVASPPAPVEASAGDVSVSVPTEGAADAMKAAGAATDATVTLPSDSSADASAAVPAVPTKK